MKAIQNTYAKSTSPGNQNPGNDRKQEFLRYNLFLELMDQFLVIIFELRGDSPELPSYLCSLSLW